MYFNIIAKNFKEQFCYNYCLNDDVLNNIFSFFSKSNLECILDIFDKYNKKNKNKIDFSYFKIINNNHNKLFDYIPLNISTDYTFYKYILHTFIKLLSSDVLKALKNPSININNNNHKYTILNNHIINNVIIIDINLYLYKNIRHHNEYFFIFKINWKLSRLIHKILYQNKDKQQQYSINNILLYNNINELIQIEYYSKIKNVKNINNKNKILTFLVIYINNYFTKLKYKYTLLDDNNYYEIIGVNKSKLYLNLTFKIFIPNLSINNFYDNNQIVHLINLYINEFLIHTLTDIL